MKVELKEVQVTLTRPFCPLCNTEVKSTGEAGRYIYDTDEAGNPTETYARKECNCSIWAWEGSLKKSKVDQYHFWTKK